MSLEIIELQNDIFGPVSLKLETGQSLVVEGASGSGKTRFLRAVADLDPAQGQVLLAGIERNSMAAFEWRKLIRMVPAHSIWWYDTVSPHFQDIQFALKNMDVLGLPKKLLQSKTADLSTGESQRLAFLRAIEGSPQVLLLDEPTSALDDRSIEQMEQMIDGELARGAIVLLASHSLEQVQKYGQFQLRFETSGLVKLSKRDVKVRA